MGWSRSLPDSFPLVAKLRSQWESVPVPVENYFESRYYIELRKAHNLFEWLVSRDTEAGRRSY
jgi:hypothetical protein